MNSYEHQYAEVAFRHISSMDPDSSDAAEYFRRSRNSRHCCFRTACG